MESLLTTLYHTTSKSYQDLRSIISKFQELRLLEDVDESILLAYKDSVIKHFEISYDLTCKFLQVYFDRKHLIFIKNEHKVFKQCQEQNIITFEEVLKFNAMTNDRFHAALYDEVLSIELCERIFDYYPCLYLIFAKVSNNFNQINL